MLLPSSIYCLSQGALALTASCFLVGQLQMKSRLYFQKKSTLAQVDPLIFRKQLPPPAHLYLIQMNESLRS